MKHPSFICSGCILILIYLWNFYHCISMSTFFTFKSIFEYQVNFHPLNILYLLVIISLCNDVSLTLLLILKQAIPYLTWFPYTWTCLEEIPIFLINFWKAMDSHLSWANSSMAWQIVWINWIGFPTEQCKLFLEQSLWINCCCFYHCFVRRTLLWISPDF